MPPNPPAAPAAPDGTVAGLYAARLAERRASVEKWERIDRRIGDGRLAAFGAGLLLFLIALLGDRGSEWAALPFAVAFAGLAIGHEPARRRLERARRASDFYARGLARLADLWPGTGMSGVAWLDPEHPYAADLDLFGDGSLFERLCLARTRAGEATLAEWLNAGADPATVRERQQAVLELRPCLDLREEIELLGTRERASIDPATLRSWGTAPRVFRGGRARGIANLLAAANVAAIAALLSGVGLQPLIGTVLATAVFARTQKRRVARALTGLGTATRDLVLIAGLLERLESQSFTTPLLGRIRARLATAGRPASARIARLARLLHLLETARNLFFMPIAALLAWRTLFATLIDDWRAANGPAIGEWLDAAGEFEALCSIAAYAAENPDDVMPEIVDGPARFEARGLGHPLIPALSSVRNDIKLGDPVQALVVSGSNMSGKSTLLRTVGTNAVLALAGAPVRAHQLRLTPLAIGATLRIQDSLREGRSRFYAEITRVRQILDLTRGDVPVLFLFDEIFHGTNSSDRRIGAEAVLRSLIASGAIGLATTHDLALADIAVNLGAAAGNVHFADTLEGGELRFDYRMKPGVVRHSNALALMRSVGLEV